MHHSDDPREAEAFMSEFQRRQNAELSDKVNRLTAEIQAGPTGEFPQGKLTTADEGEIRIGVAGDPASGKVVITFGKPVTWIGFSPQQARELATALKRRASEASGTIINKPANSVGGN